MKLPRGALRPFLRHLLEALDTNETIGLSFRNYHALGLDYLCLARTRQLTVKVYLFRPELYPNRKGYIIWPHNHRYAFEHVTLVGEILHYRFALGGEPPEPPAEPWWLHHYDADLRVMRPVLRTDCTRIGTELLAPGEHYAMTPDEIHTIALDWQKAVGDPRAIAVQLQYADVRPSTILLAPDQCVPLDPDLYQRPMPAEVARWRDEVLAELDKEA